jgi:IclR family mhp operon transcriptional activator
MAFLRNTCIAPDVWIEYGMPNSGSDAVRSLERGLRLIQAMNRLPYGSVTQLARQAEIPRTTAYRLIETLIGIGFVTNLGGKGYALTQEVRTLSDGVLDEDWIEAAWTQMVALSTNLLWPISLTTFDAPTMVVRRTTHAMSTFSVDYGMTGRRLPITETASGRVYLAYCSEPERELILAMRGAYNDDPTGLDHELLHQRLVLIRERGFDTRLGGIVAKTGSLSVPIFASRRVLGCLSLIFIAAAYTPERAIEQALKPLQQAAENIAAAC